MTTRFRPFTQPYAGAHRPVSPPRALSDLATGKVGTGGAALASVTAGLHMDRSGLNFKQCSFGRAVWALRSDGSTGLRVLRFTDRLLSPTPFPVSGESVDPGRVWLDCLLS